jgi:hypothetical protein
VVVKPEIIKQGKPSYKISTSLVSLSGCSLAKQIAKFKNRKEVP